MGKVGLIAGNSVVSGGRFEPPKYYIQNQTIKKPRTFQKHEAY